MRIANNFPALSAFTSLNRTNKSLQKSIKTLSTGLRLNSASDDAAGFAIAEKMRAQLSGLDMAIRNSQDGVSLLQTAEGALGETNSMLLRMRELSLQACNDSLTSQDRQYLQLEIDELKKQIDKISNTTQFNRKRILDGSSGALWSSSDLNVKAKINGGLTYVDQFGQKISSEGNYRIEVRAEAGEAQVQKSNIVNMVTTVRYTKVSEPIVESKIVGWDEYTLMEEKEMNWSISLNGGSNGEAVSTIKDAPNADEINSGWEYDSSTKTLTIKESGTYHIVGTNIAESTQNHIVVADGVEANILLEDVNIDTSAIGQCAFEIQPGGKANIFLIGNNTLKSGSGRAGIETRGAVNEGDKIASVVINSGSSSGSSSFDGVLNVTGGSGAAAIGGPGNISDGMSGSIEINGGTIIANGGMDAAGIGGGTKGKNGGGTITINGGDVTAISPLDAGIGTGIRGSISGDDNGGTVITITGGRVKAKGGGGAGAGIGGGLRFGSGVIKIKSGMTIIKDDPVGGNSEFLFNCQVQDSNNSGNYVYAVKGDKYTAAIGHGRGANDMSGGVDLEADIPDAVFPNVPDKPIATVQTPSIISEPIYEDILIGYNEHIEEVHTDSKLSEISCFYNANGVFTVSSPQTITITQGNGQSASIILYGTDTMQEVAAKINDVISNTFGNAEHTDNPSKFCTIADGKEGTSESVFNSESVYDEDGEFIGYNMHATMLVRSAVPGKSGELYFSGDEDVLNALGLNTIQSSTETTCTATVYDAHSGQRINEMKAEGQEFKSIIPPEIDIEVDPMAGLVASWDDNTRKFIFAGRDSYSAVIHLKDNGITFQTGANRGEDFMIQLGDTSCDSLGISGINVLTRESASRALSVIDRAINKISSQRAKIGAYQNALEDTMTNLTTTSANVTSAVSRISDADMAHETMNLVKLQILNQSGTSMLSQANQLPKSVMTLMQ